MQHQDRCKPHAELQQPWAFLPMLSQSGRSKSHSLMIGDTSKKNKPTVGRNTYRTFLPDTQDPNQNMIAMKTINSLNIISKFLPYHLFHSLDFFFFSNGKLNSFINIPQCICTRGSLPFTYYEFWTIHEGKFTFHSKSCLRSTANLASLELILVSSLLTRMKEHELNKEPNTPMSSNKIAALISFALQLMIFCKMWLQLLWTSILFQPSALALIRANLMASASAVFLSLLYVSIIAHAAMTSPHLFLSIIPYPTLPLGGLIVAAGVITIMPRFKDCC